MSGSWWWEPKQHQSNWRTKKNIILKPKSAGNQRARSQPDELQLNISVTFVSFWLCVKYVIFSFLYLDFIIAFYMIALAGWDWSFLLCLFCKIITLKNMKQNAGHLTCVIPPSTCSKCVSWIKKIHIHNQILSQFNFIIVSFGIIWSVKTIQHILSVFNETKVGSYNSLIYESVSGLTKQTYLTWQH